MAHLQAGKIECVRDASGMDGDRVELVDCGPFPTEALECGLKEYKHICLLKGSFTKPQNVLPSNFAFL